MLLGLAVLIVIGGTLFAFNFLVTHLPARRVRRRVAQRLRALADDSGLAQHGRIDGLIKVETIGPMPAVDRMMGATARGASVKLWISQAGSSMSVSSFMLRTVLCGGIAASLTFVTTHRTWPLLPAFAIGAVMPFLLIRRKRNRRLRKFEEQFPDALDLISRAVRAGHAFNTGLKMVADEIADPVGPEFRKTFDEQNFGLPVKDALDNLTQRIPILDVRFFATAVLIQRETGGNLAEILDNLASVVRERFKILRQVRVYTAHGRLTGYVLMALPAVLAVVLYFINPDHINLLFTEPMGRVMLIATVVMQTVGYVWIQKVVKIEV